MIPAATLPSPVVVPSVAEGFVGGGFGGGGISPLTLVLLFIVALLVAFLAGVGVGKSAARGSSLSRFFDFGRTGGPRR